MSVVVVLEQWLIDLPSHTVGRGELAKATRHLSPNECSESSPRLGMQSRNQRSFLGRNVPSIAASLQG